MNLNYLQEPMFFLIWAGNQLEWCSLFLHHRTASTTVGIDHVIRGECICDKNIEVDVITFLFTKLHWRGDSEGTFQALSPATTCLQHTGKFFAEFQAGKVWISISTFDATGNRTLFFAINGIRSCIKLDAVCIKMLSLEYVATFFNISKTILNSNSDRIFFTWITKRVNPF